MAKAKVGDWIRITQGSGWYENEVGSMYEVIETPKGHYVDSSVAYVKHPENTHDTMHYVKFCDYEVEFAVEPPKDYAEPVTQADAVNSPPHYTQGKHEVIDIIEFITEGYDDSFVGYCVGNTVKYVARAPFKHGSPAEDLRKAAWYLTKAADYIDGQEAID